MSKIKFNQILSLTMKLFSFFTIFFLNFHNFFHFLNLAFVVVLNLHYFKIFFILLQNFSRQNECIFKNSFPLFVQQLLVVFQTNLFDYNFHKIHENKKNLVEIYK